MTVKIVHWLGLAACVVLIVSCFLPWAYYADINQTFTGMYSYKNEYGRPGKYLAVIGAITLTLMLLPKIWAKRVNLFLCALTVGYTIKTYILFGSCYNNYCPEKQTGLYLMLFSSVIMLAASVFPEFRIGEKEKKSILKSIYPFLISFAQASFSVTVLLNTR